MSKEALSIIREFVGSNDPRQRGNAVVALAAVGGKEALRLLLDLSTTEEDTSVRVRAAAEIEALPADQIELLKALLLDDLRSLKGPSRSYAMAADLVASRKATFSELPPWKSVALAWWATRSDGKGQRFKQMWFSVLLVIAGLALGWIGLEILVAAAKVQLYINPGYNPSGGPEALEVFAMLLIGLLMGVMNINWRSQASAGWAALLELIYTTLVVVLVLAAGIAILYFNDPNRAADWLPMVSKYMRFSAESLILARLSSLCLLVGRKHSSHLGHLLRLLAIFSTSTFFLVWLATTWVGPEKGFTDIYYPSVFGMTIPMLIGFITAFEFRDWTYRAPFHPFGRVAHSVALAVPALFALWAGYHLMHTTMTEKSKNDLLPASINVSADGERIGDLDLNKPLIINFPAKGRAELKAEGPYSFSATLEGKLYPAGNHLICIAAKGDSITIVEHRIQSNLSLLAQIGQWMGYTKSFPRKATISYEMRSPDNDLSTSCYPGDY